MFRAYDAERERPVAVKLFALDLPPERGHQLVAEFERLIAAELTHPALAAPLATGIYDVSAYLVQDYVAAESLDLAVREYGPAPAADALRVAAQLAGALDFAAAVNITHGALHPRDVLLSSDDTRLTGIGIARALERAGVTAPVRRPYTAPERITGAEWDRRADVFSLAALMHELLWARRVSGVGTQAVESLTEIPGGDLTALRAAFARALAEDPADRYDTALEFAQALKDAFADVGVAAARAPSPKRRAAREVVAPQLPLLDPPSPEASAGHAAQNVARPFTAAERDEPEVVRPFNAGAEGAPDLPQEVAQPFRAAVQPADADLSLSIAAAEEERYRDVEVAPSIVEPVLAHAESRIGTPMEFAATREPDVLSALDRSRSAMWPLVLALVVGLMIGFAGGYGVGTREHPAPLVAETPPPPAVRPPPPAGREFTESAVAEPPKPAPPVEPVAPAPPQSAIRSPQSAVEAGRLLVRSTPAGARVLVDGKEYGRSPAIVRDLARGAHRVQLTREGYATEERLVTITAARPSQSMTVVMARPGTGTAAASRSAQAMRPTPSTPATVGRYTGALTVLSRPPGAEVFLDSRLVGTTPLSLRVVGAGSHALRLEHDGYRRWTSSIRIVANEHSRVTASLEK